MLFNLSAFFSGSETAFFSIDDVAVKSLDRDNTIFSRIMLSLLRNRERLLTTVLLGNEIVNVAISALSASLFMDAFGEEWVGISVFVTTFFLLIYGELLPKVVAVRYNRIWAYLASPFLWFLSAFFAPLRLVLEGASHLVTVVFGKEDVAIKEEDFKVIVDEAKSRGELEEKERRMIYRVFEFTELQVREIMVPEPDIFMVEVSISPEKLKTLVKEHRYSKIPVYEGERDNIIGYIKITDVLPVFKGLKEKALRDLIRPCYFVPETKSVQELLREFQQNRIDMAIVVNEYGAVEGLVTLEDILEELVGEIRDEYDEEREMIESLGDGTYLVDALCPLEDFLGLLGEEPPEDLDVDTAGGFVMHIFGRVPFKGESVCYGKGWRITVEDTLRRRIRKIKVEREDEVSGNQG